MVSQSVTHCHTVTKKNMKKSESYKSLIIHQGMLCISFKIGNTFNPEKLRVEVRKKLFF